MTEETKQPAKPSLETKEEFPLIIEPKTRVKEVEVVCQPLEPIKCGCAVPNKNSKTKGILNQNAMILEQVDGCSKVITDLLNQLVPRTESVESCIITHKAWQENNLKYLRGAFV